MVDQYYPSTIIIFRQDDKHPYVAYKGQEIQVPLTQELKGIDELNLLEKEGYMIRVSPDQASFELFKPGTASLIDVGTLEGNIPILGVGGKLDNSVIPAVAIVDVFEVASQPEMLALDSQVGDVAIRSDENKSYILCAEPASVLANWKWLRSPTDLVLSVAGKTGAVTLTKSDVGLSNVTNESKETMFTSVSKQVKVYNTVAQSIPNNVYTKINFDAEQYDNADHHDNVVNNTRITCKETAKYLIHVQVTFANNPTGIRGVQVRINGSIVEGIDFRNAVSAFNTVVSFSFVRLLSVNDYIELEVYQNSGGNLDVTGVSGTQFGMVKVL